MTPYEISILLHYYVSPVDPKHIDRTAPIWRPTINRFIDYGFIEIDMAADTTRTYKLTEKGEVYVKDGLCAVPFPVAKWHIPTQQDK